MASKSASSAFVGDDKNIWKPKPGFFVPGSPLYNEDGGEILKGRRDFDAAKRLLAQSGYSGQPVTLMAAQDLQDLPNNKAWGDVTVDLLQRLGVKVDFAAIDWGTVIARRAQKSSPRQGGWQMYINGKYGVEAADPTNSWLRSDGNQALNGWANSPLVEAELAAWYEANSFNEEMAAARRLNKAAMDHVLYAPLGVYLRYHAWRKNVTGVAQAPLPLFWDGPLLACAVERRRFLVGASPTQRPSL